MAGLWSPRGISWRELAKRTCWKSWEDEVFGQSARLAFYFFFAIFPVLLLLLIFLGNSAGAGSGMRGALLDSFKQVFPPGAAALIATTMRQLNERAVVGAGAILAGVSAVWGALNGTWAVMAGLNKAYEVREERPSWQVLSIALGLTIALSVLDLIALAAILYGNRAEKILGRHLGSPAHVELLWRIIQWTIILILLLFSFTLLYRFGPNLKNRRWQWSIPGAVAAVALWVVFTVLLRIYEEHFSSSQRLYGGMNAVVTLLLWLYLTGAAVFIGGEANSEIEKAGENASHPEARRPAEQRSGGEDCSKQ